MYVEGTTDLMGMIRVHHKSPPEEKEKNLHLIIERATNRYFPVYEKVYNEQTEWSFIAQWSTKEMAHTVAFLGGSIWTWSCDMKKKPLPIHELTKAISVAGREKG